jgi:hypothetical protein
MAFSTIWGAVVIAQASRVEHRLALYTFETYFVIRLSGCFDL